MHLHQLNSFLVLQGQVNLASAVTLHPQPLHCSRGTGNGPSPFSLPPNSPFPVACINVLALSVPVRPGNHEDEHTPWHYCARQSSAPDPLDRLGVELFLFVFLLGSLLGACTSTPVDPTSSSTVKGPWSTCGESLLHHRRRHDLADLLTVDHILIAGNVSISMRLASEDEALILRHLNRYFSTVSFLH